MKRWFAGFVAIVGFNWLTQLGSVLVTVSSFSIITLIAFEILAGSHSAYLGIVTFMILPGVFVTGLLIIPVGVYWHHRRVLGSEEGEAPGTGEWPVIDLNNRHTRSVLRTVFFLTFVNVVIFSLVSYKAVHYTESVEFCGQVCHTVMEPEYTAYLNSPHSRVDCVECHIGPGAPWFVKSKLSGVRQVLAVARKSYSTPIPSPVQELRPSNETCEQCHWPSQFAGDRIRVIPKFLEDEENSLVHTVLLMHIGGGHGGGKGIHSWHIDPNKTTTYLPLDEKRQEIGIVRVSSADGEMIEYRNPNLELSEEEIARAEFRTMDCIDCHNRPTHIFHSPAKAVDEKMADGTIDASLPYFKREAVQALSNAVGQEGDLDAIRQHIQDFYSTSYPETAQEKTDEIASAIDELHNIYKRNVFPKMNVTWGTYPNNLGHEEFPGCFRCHDDTHATAEGKTISGECELCHTMLAWDEEKPAILQQLQIVP